MIGRDYLRALLASRGRRFPNRRAGGQALAARLGAYARRADTLVLALPRGGVPVAFEVAMALGAQLDLLLVRKLGVPGERELAMGAIAEGEVQVLNEELVAALRIDRDAIAHIAAAEAREIARQARRYREGRPPPELRDRAAILVDDGLATGATMRAAIAAARAHGAAELVVAAPVASQDTVAQLSPLVDAIVVAEMPEPLDAIGIWYDDFGQVSDDEVRSLLRRAAAALSSRRAAVPEQADATGAG